MRDIDATLHDAIAKNAVKLERKTLWEDVARAVWAIVLAYAVFVLVCIAMAANARP